MNGTKKMNVHAKTNFYSRKRADPDEFFPGWFLMHFVLLVIINLMSGNKKIYI